MYIAGLVILIAVGLCFLFAAVENLGLETQIVSGTVVAREHREARQDSRMDVVNGQSQLVAHTTPEMYILKLEIKGRPAEATVSRSSYETAQPGDRLHVTFQQRRLTGRLQILDVTK